MNRSCVYIMTNPDNNTYYIGVTSDIKNWVLMHKNKKAAVFTSTYNCIKLVYYEDYASIQEAIAREKVF